VQEVDPVVAAAILAFGFVYIHPFEDGNGRIHRYLIHHVLADGPVGTDPRIQLFTIEELLAGKRPQVPLVERAFKMTEVEDTEVQPELEL
jgi:hypothetical protein